MMELAERNLLEDGEEQMQREYFKDSFSFTKDIRVESHLEA